MNKIRIITLMLIGILGVMVCTGCSSQKNQGGDSQNEQIAGGTIGTDLYALFVTQIQDNSDINQAAEELLSSDIFSDIATGSIPVEEGYLNGFDDEIRGFNNGVMFAPMIGTIPFVGYIFETDNPDELVQTLTDHAELNWNICTVADEMVVEQYNNYVFFVMAPESFEQ